MNKTELTEEQKDELFDKMMDRIRHPKTKLTGDDLNRLKKKMMESMSNDLQKLVISATFISGMILRFEIIPTRDFRNPTALTDGTSIYFDIDFYTKLTPSERVFVLAHEVWHNIFLHFLRRQNRDAELWNIATDCEINYMLKGDGYNPPNELCFPPSGMEGRSAEEIYEYLLKQQNKVGKKSGNGNKKSNGGQSSAGQKGGRNGSSKSGLTGQFDKHSDKDSQGGDEHSIDDILNGMPTDQWGEKGIDPDFNPHISDNVADKIREAVVAEAQKMERMKGTLPGNLQRVLKELLRPEISWRELLCQYVTTCFGDRRTWLPPQRRGVYREAYFQSRRGEKINVSVMVDTSGSCCGDLQKFMTELISLLNTFGRYDLTLIQCDSDVQSVETYDGANEFPVDDISKINFKGFGGSDMRPAFKKVQELGIEPSMNIIFTDGYLEMPQSNQLPCDSIVILTKDGNEECCPWARKIKFKND